MKQLSIFISLLSFLAFASCGEYQKVMKSGDNEYQLEKAIEYYDNEEYEKAYSLFDNLLQVYRGTKEAAKVYWYYAETSFKMEDYILAAYHYQNFAKTFGEHPRAEKAYFKIGLSQSKQSPRPSLDQSYTHKAMNSLQLFVNLYPSSDLLTKANELMDDLRQKLEEKAFQRAKLYYDIENYQSAVAAFNNVLDQYPDTQFRQKVMFFRTKAAYLLAQGSIPSKKQQRFIEARTSYREFIRSFPDSPYTEEVNKLKKNIDQKLDAYDRETNS